MKKITCFYLFIVVLILGSCGSDDDAGTEQQSNESIIGKWQLVQDFTNDGIGTELGEVELSDCDKESSIEIMGNGDFTNTSVSDSFLGDGCESDNEKGTWEESASGKFRLSFNEGEFEMGDAEFGEAEIVDGQLIVIYDFPSVFSEDNIIDKLIYSKAE